MDILRNVNGQLTEIQEDILEKTLSGNYLRKPSEKNIWENSLKKLSEKVSDKMIWVNPLKKLKKENGNLFKTLSIDMQMKTPEKIIEMDLETRQKLGMEIL